MTKGIILEWQRGLTKKKKKRVAKRERHKLLMGNGLKKAEKGDGGILSSLFVHNKIVTREKGESFTHRRRRSDEEIRRNRNRSHHVLVNHSLSFKLLPLCICERIPQRSRHTTCCYDHNQRHNSMFRDSQNSPSSTLSLSLLTTLNFLLLFIFSS